jgi:S-adenosylhomocysteine hydrolase
MIVKVSEVDSIFAMQACMDGFEVVLPYINSFTLGLLLVEPWRLLELFDVSYRS